MGLASLGFAGVDRRVAGPHAPRIEHPLRVELEERRRQAMRAPVDPQRVLVPGRVVLDHVLRQVQPDEAAVWAVYGPVVGWMYFCW